LRSGQAFERAVCLGQADPDVDLVARIVRTIGADERAGGDHLHQRAGRDHVGAEAAGLLAVDEEHPLVAGQRRLVLDVDQPGHAGLSMCWRTRRAAS
jgi:hypothetical protein